MSHRRRQPEPRGSTRLALTLLGATVPLLAAWAFTAGSGNLATEAIAASNEALAASAGQSSEKPGLDVEAEAALITARTAKGVTLTQVKVAKKRKAKAKSRRELLAHPLVGRKLGAVTKQLGKPTKRRSEGATGLIFLEYHLPNQRYQVLANGGRVVEVLRYQ